MTFVLVPGGWYDAGAYDDVTRRLRARGHRVYPVTLTGLGDDPLLDRTADLDTHIADVVDLLVRADIRDAIICGHSYGGMVMTGVADRVPQRISRLIYLDAYVPDDGDSCWSLTSDKYRHLFSKHASPDGRTVRPPPGLRPGARPHPLPALMQRIRLRGSWQQVPRKDYIYLHGWPDTPFAGPYERLRLDPSWRTHRLPTGHDIMIEAPQLLVDILLNPS
jgi:pimeloyl-ACP methyl ester carboxylesterase